MLLPDDPVRAFLPYPPVPVEGANSGPLAGVTLAVKDIYDVEGYRTGCGNPLKLAQSEIAAAHAPAVAALLDAGCRFVGKTHTDELAWSLYGANAHFGTPINPAAPDRVPGGSSSGSAAAVAAGLCDLGLGSDTGGSVRGPASFCGIFGLRPTHGAAPLGGCMALAPSLDTCGWFARDAALLARAGAVLLPPDRAGTNLSQPRLLLGGDLVARLAPHARGAFEASLPAITAALGAAETVTVYDRPSDELYLAFRHIQAREVLRVHGDFVERFDPPLGPGVRERFEFARGLTDADEAAAREIRATFTAHLEALLREDGVLVLPTVHDAAPLRAAPPEAFDAYRHDAIALLMVSGLSGLPQVTLPLGRTAEGPLGLSLLGPRGSDRALLALAERVAVVA